MGRQITLKCPHCDDKLKIVRKNDIGGTGRIFDVYTQCVDPICSYSEVWTLEAKWKLSESGKPRERDSIRVSPFKHKVHDSA